MSGSTRIAILEADIGPVSFYNKGKSDDFNSNKQMEYIEATSKILDTSNESHMQRQDTFYADSTIQTRSFERMSELENLDTIEDEEFETDELIDEVVEYRPKTLLESVDTMLSILDDLGDRYNKWKYGNNGIYRFYCHKYNLTKIVASRPYYTKILSQLNTMNNMSLHLLSSHYQKMSDSAVYSSNEVVDTVLCQLDEFVSCYCCKNCAFAISKKGAHVCSDLKVNHTCLKWKNASSAERFLTVSRPQHSNKTHMLEKFKYLNKSKSMDRNTAQQTQSTESVQDIDSSMDKHKQEEILEKIETEQGRPMKNTSSSCFIREMGYYDQCVMEYFSERGIMHNFNHPYREGEETTFIHSFLRAVVCHNCGKFCRCRCQRKIFRSVRKTTDGTIDFLQFSVSPNGLTSRSDSQETYDKVDSLEKGSMHYVNGVYEQFQKENTSSDSNLETSSDNRMVNGMSPLDVNTLYSHTLNTGFGKVQFLMNMDYNLNKNKKLGVNKSNVLETSSGSKETNNNSNITTYEDSIAINALKGSKIDSSMGSVYYSNLFKGTLCKVTVEEIFTIVNNVPFSSISEELLNHYKKAEWHELYRSTWWCLDDKFDDPKYFEDKGNLEAYVVKVLDALGYLGNLRYDAAFKVIGVGYYRKKYCYWRYFYVNRNLWECFRDSVEYFIMISTLPTDVYIDTKPLSWVATYKGVQKKFPLSPSLLKSYRHMLSFLKLSVDTLKEHKHISSYNKNKDLREYGNSEKFHNNNLKFKHILMEDYGIDVFDVTKVGTHECTVADVIGIALKRKLVSSGDSCTPRRQYIQKATTVTPTVKVKLDPEMIYQGIFATNQGTIPNSNTNSTVNPNNSSGNVSKQGNNISNSSSSSSTISLSRSDSMLSNLSNFNKINNNNNKENNVNNMGTDISISGNTTTISSNNDDNSNEIIVNGTQKLGINDNNSNNNVDNNSSNNNNNNKDMSSTDVSIDLKLNNLNTILSYYPDVCTQYSAITRQANDLRVQMSLLMSDLNKVSVEHINQTNKESNLSNNNNMDTNTNSNNNSNKENNTSNNTDTNHVVEHLINGTETSTKKFKKLNNMNYKRNNNNIDNKDYRNGLEMNISIKNEEPNNTNNSSNNNNNKENNQIKINEEKQEKEEKVKENKIHKRYDLVNGKLGNKLLDKMEIETTKHIKNNRLNNNEIDEFSTDDEDEVKELPMFDVCYNSRNNSWSCLLEVVPCLVCPLECERNGSCLHYTQGKKLIETICNRMKPCDVKYTVHPHFRTDIHSAHKGGRPEICIISFSVNQYGHERARLLASQIKATYKIQALNSMLINMSCNSSLNNMDSNSNNTNISNKDINTSNNVDTPIEKTNKDKINKEKEENKGTEKEIEIERVERNIGNEHFDKTLEMELLHNAITSQLTTMISTHSYIAKSSYHDLDDDSSLLNSGSGSKNGSNENVKKKRVGNPGNLIKFLNERRIKNLAKMKKIGKKEKLEDMVKDKKDIKNKIDGSLLNIEKFEVSKVVQQGLETNNEKMNNSIKNEDVNNTNNSNNNINNKDINNTININSMRNELNSINNNDNVSNDINNNIINDINNKENNQIKINEEKENESDNWSASGSASSFDFDMDVDTTSTTDNTDGNNEHENTFLMSDLNKVNEINTNTPEETKETINVVKKVSNRPKHYKKRYSLRNQLDNGTCICYFHGKKLVGNQGEVRVSEVLSFNDNLYTFSNMLEVKNILQINSNRLHYCPLHCCFVTIWKDAMEQTRVMYHQIERFIDFKSFNNMVTKFRNDWPNAIKLHNNYAHSIDATEGARMFAQTNRALTDCFLILLNLQKAINDSLVASLALAIRALTDASQEKNLINRLFLINKNMEVSGETVRNSLLFANEILFPFGALHDEATPPLSDDES